MSKTDRVVNGWQYGKTALECHRYMLDNEITTDVCFEVGLPDGLTISIRAHKYMLISRSAVFEAMFSSGMTECRSGPEAKIRIEDIDPDVFKELLRFIYCDKAEMTATSALELMYAAKKYMLPNLIQLCSDCLQKELTTENVCRILNQSLLFEELELKQKCLDLIVKSSSKVLKPENLQNASRLTMEAILRMDSLAEDETVIYNACISWAKDQLRNHKSIDHPNDQQIREMIGDLIYDIRFPTMDAKTFAKLVESSTVLSYEEQSSIFCYITNQHKRRSLKFNCKARCSEGQRCVDRGGSISTKNWSSGEEQCVDRGGSISRPTKNWSSGPDAIDVTIDRTILMTGLGLLSEQDPYGPGYTVELEILKASESVFRMSTIVSRTERSTPHKVAFQAPILIEPKICYTIVANSYTGKTLYSRESCQSNYRKHNVSFTFSTTACRLSNGTTHTRGQIPQIYFKIP